MPVIITPNMNLPVPVVGQEPGPLYAQDVNGAFALVDRHDHSPGNGVLITPDGLNINATLPVNSNSITQILAALFTPQPTTLASTIQSAVYAVVNTTYGSDLYFNTGNGTVVPLVLNGVVAGTPGSIAGLTAPASATYTPLSGTFTWESAANTPANMNQGPTTIANNTPGAVGVTVVPISSITVPWQFTLPASPPVSTKIVQMDSSGDLLPNLAVDGTTILNSGTVLSVGTITAANSQNAYFTDGGVGSTLSFSSTTSFNTITTIAVTASGKYPFRISIPDSSLTSAGADNGVQVIGVSVTIQSSSGTAAILGGSPTLWSFTSDTSSGIVPTASRGFEFYDTDPAVGTRTYTIVAKGIVLHNPNGFTFSWNLTTNPIAYEIH